MRHYTDESDNPSWVEETKPGQGTQVTRSVEGVSAELGAMITDTGEATVGAGSPEVAPQYVAAPPAVALAPLVRRLQRPARGLARTVTTSATRPGKDKPGESHDRRR